MKVAHINGVYGVASTGRLIRDLVQEGNKRGIESKVFYSERSADAPEAFRYITDGERKIHALESRLSGLQGYWSHGATRRLLAALDSFSPDVVHLHVVHGNCLNLPMLFNWLHRKQPKVIITLHDCWWFTGRCVHPTHYNCKKYTSDCKGCPARKDVCPSWFFDRADKQLADKRRWLSGLNDLTVVAVSDWLKGQAEESFLPADRITRIYNWLDTERFCPRSASELRRETGLEEKKIILGVANNWEMSKGLADFVALAKILPPEYQIVLIGPPPQEQFPENIRMPGATDSADQLAEWYSMSEVFVNPSRAETFGLTTVEALSCGTPVVVYDVTACPEVVGEGCGAVVSAAGGCEEIYHAVLKIDKPKQSAACRKWVTDHFLKEQACSQYFSLYQK